MIQQSGIGAYNETIKFYKPNQQEPFYESPHPSDDSLETRYVCLPISLGNKYDIQFTSTTDQSWSTKSWVEFRGIYNNRLFKSFFWNGDKIALSLYTPIQKGSDFEYSTQYNHNWFVDISETWENYHFPKDIGETSCTFFLRRRFNGMDNMAAYETQLYYQHGIVVYVNGMEVYRDNMPSGPITPHTVPTNSYSFPSYHGVVRNGEEVVNDQSVFAVELRSPSPTFLSFDCWMALYSSSTFDRSTYPLPISQSIVIGRSDDCSVMFDYDFLSCYQLVDYNNDNFYIEFELASASHITHLSYYSVDSSRAMSEFYIQTKNKITEKWGKKNPVGGYSLASSAITVVSLTSLNLQNSQFVRIYPSKIMKAIPYYICEFTFHVEPHSLSTRFPGLEFGSNHVIKLGQYIEFTPSSWMPFYECEIDPAFPKGLVMENCVIKGTPEVLMNKTMFDVYYLDNVGTRVTSFLLEIVPSSSGTGDGDDDNGDDNRNGTGSANSFGGVWLWIVLITLVLLAVMGIMIFTILSSKTIREGEKHINKTEQIDIEMIDQPPAKRQSGGEKEGVNVDCNSSSSQIPSSTTSNQVNGVGNGQTQIPMEVKPIEGRVSTSTAAMNDHSSLPSGAQPDIMEKQENDTKPQSPPPPSANIRPANQQKQDVRNPTTNEINSESYIPIYVVYNGEVIDLNSLPPREQEEYIRKNDLGID